MRIIGIDFGDARVGIAASDETEFLASTVCTLYVNGVTDAVRKCAERIKEEKGEFLVCGLPLNMDGSESFRAEKTRVFAEKLCKETGLELAFMDERLSTVEAYTYMNITDMKSSKRRGVIDAMSAQIILQSYLDKKKNAD